MRNNENSGYGYILLICNLGIQKKLTQHKFHDVHGIYSEYSDVIDLRNRAPSFFVRPHAQHGLSLRARNWSSNRDYGDHICGIVGFKIESALSWLGSGDLTKVGYMFPPPPFDDGYLKLLESYENIMASEERRREFNPNVFGSINHVWPG